MAPTFTFLAKISGGCSRNFEDIAARNLYHQSKRQLSLRCVEEGLGTNAPTA
jgi:hypothetical protein